MGCHTSAGPGPGSADRSGPQGTATYHGRVNLPADDASPLRLGLVNDHEIVLRGLHAMLKPFSDRVRIVEIDSNLPTLRPVDIALFDTYAMGTLDAKNLQANLRSPMSSRVVVYVWALTPALLRTAEELGVDGVLSKGLTAEELVDALERVHGGEFVVSSDSDVADDPSYDAAGDWPGRAEGLTQRQSEVIALIHKGLSNQEIAEATYLSPNTVKSYIKAAYRTMGVTNRTQALLWSIDHGFDEDRSRLVPH